MINWIQLEKCREEMKRLKTELETTSAEKQERGLKILERITILNKRLTNICKPISIYANLIYKLDQKKGKEIFNEIIFKKHKTTHERINFEKKLYKRLQTIAEKLGNEHDKKDIDIYAQSF